MSPSLPNTFRSGPDERGHFGIFGGRYVAETLMPLILDLEKAYAEAKADPAFQGEMNGYLKNYVGRPSPLYFAERLTEHLGGAKIYLKREELNHTGSHKVNNVLGQIMVARRMGKKRIIAETGAGQHGNAWRQGRAGAVGHAHAEGRHERGAARLGHQCAQHLLLHRHGGGPAPLSDDGARLPVRDRRGDAQADDGSRRPAAEFADRLHRRRLQCDGPVPSLSRRTLCRN